MRDDQKYQVMKHMIEQALKRRLFASHEEINDFFMWTENDFRPMMQDYTAEFMQRWLALTIENSYEAKKRLIRFLWQQFITSLIKSGSAALLPTDFEEDDVVTEGDEVQAAGLNN